MWVVGARLKAKLCLSILTSSDHPQLDDDIEEEELDDDIEEEELDDDIEEEEVSFGWVAGIRSQVISCVWCDC
jgi:hypothetical protein